MRRSRKKNPQLTEFADTRKEGLARGAGVLEPTQEAQDARVNEIRVTAVGITQFRRERAPSYFNGEGSEKQR